MFCPGALVSSKDMHLGGEVDWLALGVNGCLCHHVGPGTSWRSVPSMERRNGSPLTESNSRYVHVWSNHVLVQWWTESVPANIAEILWLEPERSTSTCAKQYFKSDVNAEFQIHSTGSGYAGLLYDLRQMAVILLGKILSFPWMSQPLRVPGHIPFLTGNLS